MFDIQTIRTEAGYDPIVEAIVYWILARQQSTSGGCTECLTVMLLQDDSRTGQLLQVGRLDMGIVPGDVVVAKIVCQKQDNIWRSAVGEIE